MTLNEKLGKQSSRFFRWLANLLTGNYLKRIDRKLNESQRKQSETDRKLNDIDRKVPEFDRMPELDRKLNEMYRKLNDIDRKLNASRSAEGQSNILIRAIFDEQQEKILQDFNERTDRRQ